MGYAKIATRLGTEGNMTADTPRSTQSGPVPQGPTSDLPQLVFELPDAEFASLVTAEVRGKATPSTALALRDPRNWSRWSAILRKEATETHVSLAQRKGDDDPQTKQWRRSVVRLQGAIQARQREISSMRDARRRLRAEGNRNEIKIAQQWAKDAALNRLAQAHREEYLVLLAEEYTSRGLELQVSDPAPADAMQNEEGSLDEPKRVARRSRRSAHRGTDAP
jgi:hypothetical protein